MSIRLRSYLSGSRLWALLCIVVACGVIAGANARDAAFMAPGASGAGNTDEAVKVEPKAEVDVGETTLGVAKNTSIFFVNQTGQPVKIEKVDVKGDANVTAEATGNDCLKQGVIAVSSRCSVEVSVTPASPGAWSVDVLMTHNGAGRITRGRLTGKTSGAIASDNKSAGLTLVSKDSKPVDFGEVAPNGSKVVRSALMVNDSADPITIYAIDVIEANNGLQRLEQGCAVDMELAPGASCPVTLLWAPKSSGAVSTDLIIRHSGRLGFAVIPIRGNAKGGTAMAATGGTDKDGKPAKDSTAIPPPLSQQELEKEVAGHIPPIAGSALGAPVTIADGAAAGLATDTTLHLIGTVGDRAVLLKPNGETEIVETGKEFEIGGKAAKLVSLTARSAVLTIDDKRKELKLEAASSLIAKAKQTSEADAAANMPGKNSGGGAR